MSYSTIELDVLTQLQQVPLNQRSTLSIVAVGEDPTKQSEAKDVFVLSAAPMSFINPGTGQFMFASTGAQSAVAENTIRVAYGLTEYLADVSNQQNGLVSLPDFDYAGISAAESLTLTTSTASGVTPNKFTPSPSVSISREAAVPFLIPSRLSPTISYEGLAADFNLSDFTITLADSNLPAEIPIGASMQLIGSGGTVVGSGDIEEGDPGVWTTNIVGGNVEWGTAYYLEIHYDADLYKEGVESAVIQARCTVTPEGDNFTFTVPAEPLPDAPIIQVIGISGDTVYASVDLNGNEEEDVFLKVEE